MNLFFETAAMRTIAGILGTAQKIAARLGPYYAKKYAVEIERDIEIPTWDGKTTKLDVYTPKTPKPEKGWPVALLIHGGGFRFFSKDSHAEVAAKISEQGYLTIAMDYRLTPAFQFPYGLIDVLSAYEWASRESKVYGGNFQELVLVGESAGANFALGLSLIACKLAPIPLFPEKRKTFSWVIPEKMILHCGYHQVSGVDSSRDLTGVSGIVKSRMRMIERDYFAKPHPAELSSEALQVADPLLMLEKMANADEKIPTIFPEVFIPVGDGDPVLTDSVKLSVALQKLQAREKLIVYPGALHAFYAMPWAKQYAAIWKDIQSFLARPKT
jgi:acetyl esterase/lipase